ncbi:Fusaric acid resistance protein family [Musa troglodytarum]|uniref:Fusaric acid resistance protein family n=1 Tax=Musa troglodytarum TaxID=320322 RepID=A0A9E7JDW9_9LILI|nr:Fusaric acid resistance protein family [Musa troglodytarum]
MVFSLFSNRSNVMILFTTVAKAPGTDGVIGLWQYYNNVDLFDQMYDSPALLGRPFRSIAPENCKVHIFILKVGSLSLLVASRPPTAGVVSREIGKVNKSSVDPLGFSGMTRDYSSSSKVGNKERPTMILFLEILLSHSNSRFDQRSNHCSHQPKVELIGPSFVYTLEGIILHITLQLHHSTHFRRLQTSIHWLCIQKMSGKKGSTIRIDIGLPSSAVPRETATKSGGGDGDEAIIIPLRKWMMEVWQFAREDTNRVTFSLKVGLACLLVSLLILLRAPYQIFGTNIIWSILTVAIMFEYTVGATFNRGFNRALGSLLAGVFAVVVIQVAMSSGHVAEPYVIGLSIFLVGSITSFMKLWPSLVPYEYGFRVILFTYCLIIVSGYRMGNPIRTAMDRLYSIAIGAIVAVLVNVLIFPIWAGEQLHRELVGHFDSVADSLEECVKKYLSDDGSDHPEFSKTVMDDFQDEPAYRKCRSTLNSSAKLDSLANSAKWEPPHGRFMQMFYPWAEYVKVGAVLRHCAYEVMALHGCLHSEIQAPYNLRYTFRTEILDATNQAAELLRSLAKDLSNMKHSLHTSLLKRVHASTERLQRSIDLHSYLLTLSHDVCDCPTKPPAKLSHVSSFNGTDADGKKAEAETYHETMKKQQRRLHSWPSREVDDFEEDMSGESIPRMRALESTAALSLATFTSLLIEFVARLDHLVEAADELAKLAKFKQEIAC